VKPRHLEEVMQRPMKKTMSTKNTLKLLLAAVSFAALPLVAHADNSLFGPKSFLESLTKKLGKDWNINASGGKIVATKKETAEKASLDTDKVTKECRDVMDNHKQITVTEEGSTVKVTGRTNDCGSLASDIDDIAEVRGVNRLEIGVLCDGKSDKTDKKM
jgi:hypothetical protein